MLKNLKLSVKLYLSFAIILALMLIQTFVTVTNSQTTVDNFDTNAHTYRVMADVRGVLQALTDVETGVRGYLIAGEEDFLEPYYSGLESVERYRDDLRSATTDNPLQQDRLDDLRGVVEELLAIFASDIEQRGTGVVMTEAVAANFAEAESRVAMDEARSILGSMYDTEERLLDERSQALESQLTTANVAAIIMLVIGLGVGGTVATLISTSTSRRLRYMRDIAESTADGDLTVVINADRNDEIGLVVKALQRMQEGLRTMMGEIAQGAHELKTAADRISTVSTQSADSATDQSESASNMATTVEELTNSIGDVSANAERANEISVRAGKVSNEGSEVIEKSSAGMERIEKTVRNTSKDIGELGERSKEISSIINTIRDIAEQTNLLALNAAIEAARAGEQGRGFAVVADEVRNLAERTAKSTNEIADMIGGIQSGTEQAVTGMEDGVKLVDEGVQLAGQAGQSMRDIRAGTEEVLEVVNNISEALKEQSSASNEVAQTIERIAQMAQENRDMAFESSAAAEQLTNLSSSLATSVERFKL